MLLSIVCGGGVDFAKKIFPPKNLYILFLAGKYILLPLPFPWLPNFVTRCLCCLSQFLPNFATRCLCCLRILEPCVAGPSFYLLLVNFLADGRSRTAKPWIAGLSSYPLDHEGLVGRIILELPDMLWGWGVLNKSKNIFNRSVYILSFLAGNVF